MNFSIALEWVSAWCNGQSYGLGNCNKRVRTPVALLRSLSVNVIARLEFELAYEKGMNPLILPVIRLNIITTGLLGEWLWHLLTYKGWYTIKQRKQPIL